MSEWKKVRLGEVAESFRVRVDPSDLGDAKVVHFSIPAFDVRMTPTVEPASGIHSHKFRVDEDSVLVSMLNPRIPRVWFAAGAENALASTEFAVLRPKDPRTSLAFLYCLCRSSSFTSMLDERSTGTTGSRKRSKAADALAYTFFLPPLRVQERIVEVIGTVDDQIVALDAETEALKGMYRAATSLLWCTPAGEEADSRLLSDVMRLDVLRVPMEAGTTYHLAGVLNAGKGLVDKDAFDGVDTEYTAMNVLRENQVVMRKLTAWEGPITVVPAGFDGFVASNEFPTFTLASDIAPGWMKHVCRTPRLWAEMQSRVVGTVQRRKRLNPDQLLSVALPVPSRPEQEQVAEALDAIEEQIAAIHAEAARLREVRARLLSGLLDRTIDIESAELGV
uniref:restriction endonuclease subunit S n=1 Tax=Streptomyces sp. CHD11 TaxID=2741325 RepID=UPI001BFCAD22|nr:restriction endonuclease subunit S [Streptomyces sp. CHD11]